MHGRVQITYTSTKSKLMENLTLYIILAFIFLAVIAIIDVSISNLRSLKYFQTNKKKSMYKFEVYPDKAGEYRWRMISTYNGNIVADSSEGYKNIADIMEMVRNIRAYSNNADIKVITHD